MMPPVSVRLLGSADCAALAALEAQCFPDSWSPEQFRAAMSRKSFAALGAEDVSGLVAYVTVYHIVDEVEILNLGVAPAARGTGNGRAFLLSCLGWWRERDVARVLLEVRPSNVAAIRLYHGCGFRKTGSRPGYFQDTGEDALLMEWGF
jgi:ribosomal-protein-alanine N-acetyltransferase